MKHIVEIIGGILIFAFKILLFAMLTDLNWFFWIVIGMLLGCALTTYSDETQKSSSAAKTS